MKTSKPLQELIPDMIDHIRLHKDSHIQYNSDLINISNGALLPYVEDSMMKELNPRAFERSRQRIPPINVLSKLQTKLSKVYAETPNREAGENTIDNEMMGEYVDMWDLDGNLSYANDLLVINKYCALEPYQHEGEAKMRVLSAKDFIVFSDSRTNPNEMTVFIKFMGHMDKALPSDHTGDVMNVRSAVFYAYSDDEFMVFNEHGDIMEQMDNPYRFIPFIYLRSNNNELIPTPDSDNLPMTVLIPKLMADLNYAVMFGCRSQIVGIDIEMDNVEMSPDSLWILNSVPGENKSPSLDTIKSDVDVEKVLTLINTQLGLWLDTKGIKTGSIGKATVENAASGISKLIDESDATAVNRKYKKIFANGEKRLWKLLPDMHQTWLANGETDMKRLFSSQYEPSVELIDSKVVPDNMSILEELKLENELGIFDKESGLRRLNPEDSEDQIAEKLQAVENKISINMPNQPVEDEEDNNDGE
jgi:hypothetical protein